VGGVKLRGERAARIMLADLSPLDTLPAKLAPDDWSPRGGRNWSPISAGCGRRSA